MAIFFNNRSSISNQINTTNRSLRSNDKNRKGDKKKDSFGLDKEKAKLLALLALLGMAASGKGGGGGAGTSSDVLRRNIDRIRKQRKAQAAQQSPEPTPKTGSVTPKKPAEVQQTIPTPQQHQQQQVQTQRQRTKTLRPSDGVQMIPEPSPVVSKPKPKSKPTGFFGWLSKIVGLRSTTQHLKEQTTELEKRADAVNSGLKNTETFIRDSVPQLEQRIASTKGSLLALEQEVSQVQEKLRAQTEALRQEVQENTERADSLIGGIEEKRENALGMLDVLDNKQRELFDKIRNQLLEIHNFQLEDFRNKLSSILDANTGALRIIGEEWQREIKDNTDSSVQRISTTADGGLQEISGSVMEHKASLNAHTRVLEENVKKKVLEHIKKEMQGHQSKIGALKESTLLELKRSYSLSVEVYEKVLTEVTAYEGQSQKWKETVEAYRAKVDALGETISTIRTEFDIVIDQTRNIMSTIVDEAKDKLAKQFNEAISAIGTKGEEVKGELEAKVVEGTERLDARVEKGKEEIGEKGKEVKGELDAEAKAGVEAIRAKGKDVEGAIRVKGKVVVSDIDAIAKAGTEAIQETIDAGTGSLDAKVGTGIKALDAKATAVRGEVDQIFAESMRTMEAGRTQLEATSERVKKAAGDAEERVEKARLKLKTSEEGWMATSKSVQEAILETVAKAKEEAEGERGKIRTSQDELKAESRMQQEAMITAISDADRRVEDGMRRIGEKQTELEETSHRVEQDVNNVAQVAEARMQQSADAIVKAAEQSVIKLVNEGIARARTETDALKGPLDRFYSQTSIIIQHLRRQVEVNFQGVQAFIKDVEEGETRLVRLGTVHPAISHQLKILHDAGIALAEGQGAVLRQIHNVSDDFLRALESLERGDHHIVSLSPEDLEDDPSAVSQDADPLVHSAGVALEQRGVQAQAVSPSQAPLSDGSDFEIVEHLVDPEIEPDIPSKVLERLGEDVNANYYAKKPNEFMLKWKIYERIAAMIDGEVFDHNRPFAYLMAYFKDELKYDAMPYINNVHSMANHSGEVAKIAKEGDTRSSLQEEIQASIRIIKSVEDLNIRIRERGVIFEELLVSDKSREKAMALIVQNVGVLTGSPAWQAAMERLVSAAMARGKNSNTTSPKVTKPASPTSEIAEQQIVQAQKVSPSQVELPQAPQRKAVKQKVKLYLPDVVAKRLGDQVDLGYFEREPNAFNGRVKVYEEILAMMEGKVFEYEEPFRELTHLGKEHILMLQNITDDKVDQLRDGLTSIMMIAKEGEFRESLQREIKANLLLIASVEKFNGSIKDLLADDEERELAIKRFVDSAVAAKDGELITSSDEWTTALAKLVDVAIRSVRTGEPVDSESMPPPPDSHLRMTGGDTGITDDQGQGDVTRLNYISSERSSGVSGEIEGRSERGGTNRGIPETTDPGDPVTPSMVVGDDEGRVSSMAGKRGVSVKPYQTYGYIDDFIKGGDVFDYQKPFAEFIRGVSEKLTQGDIEELAGFIVEGSGRSIEESSIRDIIQGNTPKVEEIKVYAGGLKAIASKIKRLEKEKEKLAQEIEASVLLVGALQILNGDLQRDETTKDKSILKLFSNERDSKWALNEVDNLIGDQDQTSTAGWHYVVQNLLEGAKKKAGSGGGSTPTGSASPAASGAPTNGSTPPPVPEEGSSARSLGDIYRDYSTMGSSTGNQADLGRRVSSTDSIDVASTYSAFSGTLMPSMEDVATISGVEMPSMGDVATISGVEMPSMGDVSTMSAYHFAGGAAMMQPATMMGLAGII